jgi:hypothetical protein
MYIYTYKHIYIYTCIHVYNSIRQATCFSLSIYTHTHTHTQTCMYTYIQQHLSGNMFPLLIFGKLVEEDLGAVVCVPPIDRLT